MVIIVKTIFVILLLLFAIQLNARENFNGLRYDYILHYETSLIMSVCIARWHEKEDYGILSIGFPLFVGGMKEISDHDKYWWKDMTFNILGAISGKLLSYSF